MKLSKKTLDILKYLSTVYPSILIKSGSVLRSRNEPRNALVKVNIEESFPVDFVLYDISNFLKVVDLFTEPDIEFVGDIHSGHMVLSENSATLRYKFSSPELHANIPADVDYVPPDGAWSATFKLDDTEIDNILNVAKVMNLDEISFTADKIKLKNSKSTENFTYFDISYQNEFKVNGVAPDGFYLNFSMSSFNLFKGSYNVEFFCGGDGKPNGGKFTKVDNDVTVWIGCSSQLT